MRKRILSIGILLTLGLTACQESIDVFVPFDPSYSALPQGDVNQIFDNLSPEVRSYEWNVADAKVVETPGGVELHIPANAFVNGQGETVSGSVTLNLVEMLSAGQMIIHDKPNVASGEILEAAGNFLLEAEQQGLKLELAAEKLIQLQIPVNSTQGTPNPEMRLFYGNNQNPEFFNWEPSSLVVETVELLDSLTMEVRQVYRFVVDRLGWLGCNAFVEEIQQWSTLCVDLPPGFDSENTAVYIAFQNLNGLAKLFNNEARELSSFCKDLIPTQSEVVVITLSVAGDGTYYFNYRVVFVDGSEVRISLQPQKTSLETIKSFLSEL